MRGTEDQGEETAKRIRKAFDRRDTREQGKTTEEEEGWRHRAVVHL